VVATLRDSGATVLATARSQPENLADRVHFVATDVSTLKGSSRSSSDRCVSCKLRDARRCDGQLPDILAVRSSLIAGLAYFGRVLAAR
jgi:hypothetical protein